MITSELNFLAHGIKKKENVDWATAMKIAYQAMKVKNAMRDGVVEFSFTKKSTGEVREARGTVRLDLIPGTAHPKGNRPPAATNTVAFYDLDKNGWRSFAAITLIERGVAA